MHRTNIHDRISAAGLLLAFMIVAAPGRAVPLLEAELVLSGGDGFASPGPDFTRRTIASGPLADSGISDVKGESFHAIPCCGFTEIFGGGRVLGAANAAARPGELRLSAFAHGESFGSGQAVGRMSSEARATFSIFDLIFTGPAPFVSGTLPILVEGDFAVDATYGTSEQRRGAGLSDAAAELTLIANFARAGYGASAASSPTRRSRSRSRMGAFSTTTAAARVSSSCRSVSRPAAGSS
jgi:hypothetical protein